MRRKELRGAAETEQRVGCCSRKAAFGRIAQSLLLFFLLRRSNSYQESS
jgi:hypothetical protein